MEPVRDFSKFSLALRCSTNCCWSFSTSVANACFSSASFYENNKVKKTRKDLYPTSKVTQSPRGYYMIKF